MLKTKHTGLINLIARVLTDMLHGAADVSAVWCISLLIVLYKKGDASLPKNHRPIAIIPVLCKLFSGVLLGRIDRVLDALQDPEQGGFSSDNGASQERKPCL